MQTLEIESNFVSIAGVDPTVSTLPIASIASDEASDYASDLHILGGVKNTKF